MPALQKAWSVSASDGWRGPVTLPRIHYTVACCFADSPQGWVCTRPEGHTGRHAATNLDFEVLAVWP